MRASVRAITHLSDVSEAVAPAEAGVAQAGHAAQLAAVLPRQVVVARGDHLRHTNMSSAEDTGTTE